MDSVEITENFCGVEKFEILTFKIRATITFDFLIECTITL